MAQLNSMLEQLEHTSQGTLVDLAKTRVDKWKTDAGTKHESQSNIEALSRNLQSALPAIISELRASPENLTSTFKLYRNLDALYSVFSSVVESTGAFGSKDEFQALSNDLSVFERSRRSFGDRMETLAAAKEGELSRMRNQMQNAQAAAATPPKKVIVDDTAPAKKAPAKKKASPAGKPAAPSSTQPQTQ